MRIGVYGGTFNPIHLGHVHILREFIGRLDLQKVLLIPDGTPPHKVAEDLAPPEDRVKMCRIATEELGIVDVSRMELTRPGKSFTSDTLTQLHELYPRDELYFLMGEDMFLTVDKWHDAPTIFRLAVLCASPRSHEGYEGLIAKQRELEALGARCRVEDIPFLDASSTRVRELAREGKDISGLVPKAVAEYISENRIYGGRPMTFEEYEALVKPHLSECRFYHSQCVAKCAAELAEKYGADVEKARLAGILHDVMKDTAPEEQLKIMERSGIILTEAQRRNTKLWHALSGAAFVESELGVADRDILDAIACHTGGKAGMTTLDKVLFVADYISADRDYPGVEELRIAAESSLEEVIVEGITFTMQERMGQRMTMEPRSIDAYNEALWILESKEKG